MRADGVSWRAYDRFMQSYVKRMGDERLTKLPPDLDLKPYRDEHDYDLMRRMAAAARRPRASRAWRRRAAPPPRQGARRPRREAEAAKVAAKRHAQATRAPTLSRS